MKIVSLQETPTHYLIEVDRTSVEEEPTLLEREGQPVAVLIPIDDYYAFQKWQATQQKSVTSVPSDFEAEVAAFKQLKPALLENYQGRVVAIYQGQVVEVGDDKMEVLARVLDRFGNVPCYIEWVEPEAPRRARVPSAWVATNK